MYLVDDIGVNHSPILNMGATAISQRLCLLDLEVLSIDLQISHILLGEKYISRG